MPDDHVDSFADLWQNRFINLFAFGATAVLLLFFPFSGSYVLVWQKGDDVLTAQSIMVSPDRRFKLLPDHTLELRNINPRDGGDYSCKISVLGDPIEITHTLEILCKSINPVIFFHISLYIVVGVVAF